MTKNTTTLKRRRERVLQPEIALKSKESGCHFRMRFFGPNENLQIKSPLFVPGEHENLWIFQSKESHDEILWISWAQARYFGH
jgi:hypothetical protein